MVTLAKDFDVNNSFDDGFSLAPRGAFLGDSSGELALCYLHIGGATLPIDIPLRALTQQRRSSGEILLAVAADETASVRRSSAIRADQERDAQRWAAEMQDFDRF